MYEKSIELLKRAVSDELTAVHQYMYLHFHCDHQGLDLISNLFRATAIQEMMHIERIAERILYLGGDVRLEPSEGVKTVQDVREMLELACSMEKQSIQDYNQWALDAGPDSATRKLFEDLVADEERHFGQYDHERENVSRFGEGYLAQQAMEKSRAIGRPAAGA